MSEPNGEGKMSETRHTKIFQKKPYTLFEKAVDVLGIPAQELTKKLGYTSTSTAAAWAVDKEIPYVAGVALELMLQQHYLIAHDKVYLLRLPQSKAAILHPILKALELEFVVI